MLANGVFANGIVVGRGGSDDGALANGVANDRALAGGFFRGRGYPTRALARRVVGEGKLLNRVANDGALALADLRGRG